MILLMILFLLLYFIFYYYTFNIIQLTASLYMLHRQMTSPILSLFCEQQGEITTRNTDMWQIVRILGVQRHDSGFEWIYTCKCVLRCVHESLWKTLPDRLKVKVRGRQLEHALPLRVPFYWIQLRIWSKWKDTFQVTMRRIGTWQIVFYALGMRVLWKLRHTKPAQLHSIFI